MIVIAIDSKKVAVDIEYIHPRKAYLTHLGTEWDYDLLLKKLPKNIKPVYDGLKINT